MSIPKDVWEEQIQRFLRISNSINDTWILSERAGMKYLMKKNVLRESYLQQHNYQEDTQESELNEVIELQDVATISSANKDGQKVAWSFDYHIVYSEVYCVPVLYFQCSNLDGSLVRVEHLLKSIEKHHLKEMEHAQWPAISQEDHPILSAPYFFLHPCRTAEMMQNVCQPLFVKSDPLKEAGKDGGAAISPDYLTTWLSLLAPIVGLHLDYRYAIL